MNVKVLSRPAAAIAQLAIDQGETVVCEVGSMIAMTSGISVQTTSRNKAGGGIMKGLKRMFAGESFFLNHFTADKPKQSLMLGPSMLGDIVEHRLTGGTLIVQGSSWMASESTVEIDATWQGITRGIFGGEGLFWVKCSGSGSVLLNSFGAVYDVNVDEEFIIDTGHIVAFEDTLQFRVDKAGASWIGSFLGGEALVCKFTGQGKLYYQTHNPSSFGSSLGPKLRARG